MEQNEKNGYYLVIFALILIELIPYWNKLTENIQVGIGAFILILGLILIIDGLIKRRKKLKEERLNKKK